MSESIADGGWYDGNEWGSEDDWEAGDDEYSQKEMDDAVTDKQCSCGDTRREILKAKPKPVITLPVWDGERLVSRGFELRDCPNCRSPRKPSKGDCYACNRTGLPIEQHHVFGRSSSKPGSGRTLLGAALDATPDPHLDRSRDLPTGDKNQGASRAHASPVPLTVPLCVSCHLLVTIGTKPRREGGNVWSRGALTPASSKRRRESLERVREEAQEVFHGIISPRIAERHARESECRAKEKAARDAKLVRQKAIELAEELARETAYNEMVARGRDPIPAEAIERWLAGGPMRTEPSPWWTEKTAYEATIEF